MRRECVVGLEETTIHTLGGVVWGTGTDALAQLVLHPELHADERLSALLGQLTPGLWPGQDVTHTTLRKAQHLHNSPITLAIKINKYCV